MDDMDVVRATGGRFAPRIVDGIAPSGMDVAGGITVIRRDGGRDTVLETGISGLGAVALLRSDGRVLGYGTLNDVAQIADLADSIDRAEGRTTDGGPLSRLAEHGLHLVLPFEAMPEDLRTMLAGPDVPMDFLEVAVVTDEAIAEIMAMATDGGHVHDHGDGSECATCREDAVTVSEHIADVIDREGHAVLAHPDAGGLRSYTIGLAETGWPELVVVGLPYETSVILLNDAVAELRARGAAPKAGDVLARTANVAVRMRHIERRPAEALRYAAQRLDDEDIGAGYLRALQIIWPDPAGTYPDRPGYDRRYPQELL